MRRLPLRISLLLTAVAIIGCVAFLSTIDAHQANLRWILWKHHLWPYDANIALRYLNVDVDFRQSLQGKSKSEIRRWFPVLVPKEKATTPSQKYYSREIHEPDFYWIDDSDWAVWFENDKVKDLSVIKG